ncbi:uncharacterized protein LOC123532583 [Mercenaria mercenaria]|uniref:uncharacterized protein LOC123532583 n=1 Tax=Mercenaria mercenaria TaxID=6596 RepID=UPI00234EB4D9|nr:uncharacterized protein LOC123532583 [Mercenaria mercenaria]
MDTTENVENTVDQLLHPEQNSPQGKFATGNQVSQQTNNKKDKQATMKKRGAVRMAGFLFWINLVGVLLLLVGFVAPGWLTIKANQRLHKSSYALYYDSETPSYLHNVYQDYALWYVTQCYEHDGRNTVCETMTYRTIDGIYGEDNTNYEKIEIGEMEKVGDDRFVFHGAGLVLFLLVPVFMFAVVRGDLRENELSVKFYDSLGSAFAGCGGGVMALIAITIFLQLVFCRNQDA